MFDHEKFETLFGMLAILICLNCKAELWGNAIKAIKNKKHHRPSYSLFNYGMRILGTVFSKIKDYLADVQEIIRMLT
jgi:hypothetical protein